MLKEHVCLAEAPWQVPPGRTQQLMARLDRARTLYFAPAPGMRRAAPRRVRPGLTVYSLPPAPETDGGTGALYLHAWTRRARLINRALDRQDVQDPVLWCTRPDQIHLVDLIPHRALVYDCAREWDGFPLRWESDLALAADVVFAASPGLVRRLSPCSGNIALLPNAAGPVPAPPEGGAPGFFSPEGAVLGLWGALSAHTDLSPVVWAAQALPECTFVLMGRAERCPHLAALRSLPNVILTGPLPRQSQGAWLARFDVCLSLPARGAPSDVLPPGFYEALRTGKPLVAALAEGQVEPFPDVVYAAHSPREFARLCTAALAECGDWARRRRQTCGRANTWDTRAGEAGRILEAIGLY